MATILVVSDRPAGGGPLAALLSAAGYRVVEARRGPEALERVRAERPELIVVGLPSEVSEASDFVATLRDEPGVGASRLILSGAAPLPGPADPPAGDRGVTARLTPSMTPGMILRTVEGVLASEASPTPPADDAGAAPPGPGGWELARRRLEALAELGHWLSQERAPGELLERCCLAAGELVGARHAVLAVLDEAAEEFRLVVEASGPGAGAPAWPDRPSPREGLLGRVLAEGGPVRGYGRDGGAGADLAAAPGLPPVGAFLGVPLDSAGRAQGVLCFAEKQDGAGFDEHDEAVALILAGQVAAAYENARRRAEAGRQAARLEREGAERRRAEATLRESEERFRQLAESIHDVFWLRDLGTDQVLYVSPAYEELWGCSRESLYADAWSWTDAIHPDDRPRILAAARLKLERDDYDEQYRIQRPDGSIRWIRDRCAPVARRPGAARRLAGIAEDITERKRTEIALERYAERLANLRRIDRSILEAHQPRQIAEAALGPLRRMVPCWHATVWLLHFEAGAAEVLTCQGAAAGHFPPGTKVPLWGIDLTDVAAMRRGEARRVADVAPLPDPPSLLRDLRAVGLRSYARIPMVYAGELVGWLSLGWDRPGGLAEDDLEVAREVADLLAVAIRHALLFDEVRAGRERLQTLSRQLLKVQEEERRHMARELHDEIGQSLTAAKINLQHAMASDDPSSSKSRLEENEALLDRILHQVRNLSLDLRPSALDDLGLVAALRWYLDRVARRAGFAGRFSAEPPEIRVDPDLETACFRVAQEALTNVVRYARAQHVFVGLTKGESHLELVVRDDGTGFDVSAARRRAVQGASLGLLGMQERAELLGGRIEIASEPGQGAELRAWLPLSLPVAPGPPEAEDDQP